VQTEGEPHADGGEGLVCALNWLDEELAVVKPQVIVALGSVALKYLLGPEGRITRDRAF
jgi:uracil-DNA glycosylase